MSWSSRSPHRTHVLVVTLLICVFALVSCGSTRESDEGSGITPRRSTDECDSIPSYVEGTPSATLDKIAARLRDANRATQKPSGYAGIVLCGGANTVLLFWKGSLSDPAQAVVDDEAPHVLVREAPNSANELKAAIAKVDADEEYWKAKGVVIEAAGPAEQNGTSVHIGISGSKSAGEVQKEFDKKYANSALVVTEEPPSDPL